MFLTLWTGIGGVLLLGYAALLLWLRGGLRKPGAPPVAAMPFVSVIVPLHNEAAHLPALLHCLRNQNYPTDRLEILLVNDRSTDETPSMIDRCAAEFPCFRTLHIDRTPEDHSPKKHAIVTAITAAQGEVIITTDGDGLPGPQWISRMAACFTEKVDVVLGYAPYRTDGPFHTFFHRMLALEYFSLGAVAAAAVGRAFPLTSNGVNFAYRKSLFQRVNGFGETITELSGDDDLLLHRFLSLTDARVAYAAQHEAAVPNAPPTNLKRFIRQRIRFSSKHAAYPLRVMPILFLVYFFHLWTLATLTITISYPGLWPQAAIALFLKMTCEIVFLQKGQDVLESRPLLRYYPLAVLPHLFYVVFVPVFAQLLPKRW